MTKAKSKISLILVFFILIYYLSIFFSNKSYASLGIRERTTDLSGLTNEQYPGISALINELKTAHSNWNFTILYTGLDWNEVLYNETTAEHGKSLTDKTSYEWLCTYCNPNMNELVAQEPGWYCASQEAVAYYLDIRNWLNEDYIFTFESLTYDANTQTLNGVEKILKGTFMETDTITYIDTKGTSKVIEKSYAKIIMEAAEEYNVSAYHLASRLRQEQGSGNSGLISGTFKYTDGEGNVEDYTGYYNYFNINAYGNTNAKIIRNGLKYASSDKRDVKWTTPELAIKGGAKFLANEYIGQYQDNIYLQKYCVDSQSNSLYSHQYMTNVSAPFSEGNSVKKAYAGIENMLNDSSFNFVIPVYENMPTEICKKPASNMVAVTNNVQTNASYLKLRTGPSTNYSEITSIPRDSVLIRIEMASLAGVDGNYWDKVVYDNGEKLVMGYATREYLVDVADVETCNEPDVTNSSVNLRNGPGTVSTTILKTLSKNSNVTIIDKVPYLIDGHKWYRVKLEDGTQGYIAATYLKSYVPQENSNYKIDGNYIKIVPKTQISELPEGIIFSEDKLKTGSTIKINEQSYVIIMLGDVNEDGAISPADYVKIKNHIMGTTSLEDKNKIAADANGDGNVTPADYVKVKNHIMSVSEISF